MAHEQLQLHNERGHALIESYDWSSNETAMLHEGGGEYDHLVAMRAGAEDTAEDSADGGEQERGGGGGSDGLRSPPLPLDAGLALFSISGSRTYPEQEPQRAAPMRPPARAPASFAQAAPSAALAHVTVIRVPAPQGGSKTPVHAAASKVGQAVPGSPDRPPPVPPVPPALGQAPAAARKHQDWRSKSPLPPTGPEPAAATSRKRSRSHGSRAEPEKRQLLPGQVREVLEEEFRKHAGDGTDSVYRNDALIHRLSTQVSVPFKRLKKWFDNRQQSDKRRRAHTRLCPKCELLLQQDSQYVHSAPTRNGEC